MTLNEAQITEDILFFHEIISENNPFKFLKERTHNVHWDDLKEQFIAWGKTVKTPEDYVRLMQRIGNMAKCGHICISPDWILELRDATYFGKSSPWRLIASDEEIYTSNQYWSEVLYKIESEADAESASEPQRQAPKLHDVELDNNTLYISIPMMWIADNKSVSSWHNKVVDLLKNYQNLIVDIRGNCGGGDSAWTNLLSMIICEDMVTPLVYFYRAGNHVQLFCKEGFTNSTIEDINNCPTDVYSKADKSLFTNEFATPFFINSTVKKKEDSINFSGKIAVIMDRCNFSSAEAFLVRVQYNKWATLIGETSGGDGIGCSPAIFTLPNSKLCVRYPVTIGLNPDGTINDEYPVAPDIHTMVKPFDKPLHLYDDNGREWLLHDEAVTAAMAVFTHTE